MVAPITSSNLENLPCPLLEDPAVAAGRLTGEQIDDLGAFTCLNTMIPVWRPFALLLAHALLQLDEPRRQRLYVQGAIGLLLSGTLSDRDLLYAAAALHRALPGVFEAALMDRMARGELMLAASRPDEPQLECFLHLLTPLLRHQLDPGDIALQVEFEIRLGRLIEAIRERRKMRSPSSTPEDSVTHTYSLRERVMLERSLNRRVDCGLKYVFGPLARGRRTSASAQGIRPQIWPFVDPTDSEGDLRRWQDQPARRRCRAADCLTLDGGTLRVLGLSHRLEAGHRVALDWPVGCRPVVMISRDPGTRRFVVSAIVRGIRGDHLVAEYFDVEALNGRCVGVRCNACFSASPRLYLPPGGRWFACGWCSGVTGALPRLHSLGAP